MFLPRIRTLRVSHFERVPGLVQSPNNLDYVNDIIFVPFRLNGEIEKYIKGSKVENLTARSLY
tara:strand:+ start:35 stop:223 length:189 start_codon:yes stop_codon:yes gene_type:complete